MTAVARAAKAAGPPPSEIVRFERGKLVIVAPPPVTRVRRTTPLTFDSLLDGWENGQTKGARQADLVGCGP
jgi:hypothetical protein